MEKSLEGQTHYAEEESVSIKSEITFGDYECMSPGSIQFLENEKHEAIVKASDKNFDCSQRMEGQTHYIEGESTETVSIKSEITFGDYGCIPSVSVKSENTFNDYECIPPESIKSENTFGDYECIPSGSFKSENMCGDYELIPSESIKLESINNDKQEAIVQESNKKFDCDECGMRFLRKCNMTEHKKTHSGEKSFVCDECGKAFGRSSYLTRHKRFHSGEKNFACDECGMKFSQKGHARAHKETHSRIIQLPFCDECGTKFKTKSALKRHKMKHPILAVTLGRAHNTEGASPETVSIKSKITFGDNECMPSELQAMRNEKQEAIDKTSGKKFECDECGLTLSRKHNLIVHKKTHIGDKAFGCGYCGKTFVRKHDLTRHIRTHSGEKPFECEGCGMKFTQKGHATAHKETHEPIIPCVINVAQNL